MFSYPRKFLLAQVAYISLFVLITSEAFTQEAYVQRLDSTVARGAVRVNSKGNLYNIQFRCENCNEYKVLSNDSARAVRERSGNLYRFLDGQWLKEISNNQVPLYRDPQRFFVSIDETLVVVPQSKSQIEELFQDWIDCDTIRPYSKSLFRAKEPKLERLIYYIENDIGNRFPISAWRAGIIGFGRIQSFKRKEIEAPDLPTYVTTDSNYWSTGYGVFIGYDAPLAKNGWMSVSNEIRVVHNRLEADGRRGDILNAVEDKSWFLQYRLGLRFVYRKLRSWYPYASVGAGANLLLSNESTFLSVLENLDKFNVDYREFDTYNTFSFSPFAALGSELLIGKKLFKIELGAEYETSSAFNHVFSFYLSTAINLN